MKNKNELWRKYKGTTAEELCAAIRELWLAKYPDYLRLLNEIPNRLIEEVATLQHPYEAERMDEMELTTLEGIVIPEKQARVILDANATRCGRNLLKDLEKFLNKLPFQDHMSDDLLFEETVCHQNPDAPISEYVEAEKKRDALVKKFAIRLNK
jgi:hypothetical protein